MCQAEGRYCGPDAAGANGRGIVGEGLLNMPGKGLTRLGAVTRQDTEARRIHGDGGWLQGLKREA